MSDFENTIWCVGCGTEIIYRPFMVNDQEYCCQECALEMKCNCGRAMERAEDHRYSSISIDKIFPGN